MLRFVMTAALCVLSACSQPPPTPFTATSAPVDTPIVAPDEPTAADFSARYAAAIKAATQDKSTPEAALQSWWTANQAMLDLDCEFNAQSQKADEPWRQSRHASFVTRNDALLTGEAEASFHASIASLVDTECVKRTFNYEVQATKPEGSGKTVITALARNMTPLPESLTLTAEQLKQRHDGTRYRYTLLSVDGGWRISRIEMNRVGLGWLDMTAAGPKSKTDIYYFAFP